MPLCRNKISKNCTRHAKYALSLVLAEAMTMLWAYSEAHSKLHRPSCTACLAWCSMGGWRTREFEKMNRDKRSTERDQEIDRQAVASEARRQVKIRW